MRIQRFYKRLSFDDKLTWIIALFAALFILWMWITRPAFACDCYAKPTPTPTSEETPAPSTVPTPESSPHGSDTGGDNGNSHSGSTTPASAPSPVTCTISFTAPVLTQFQTNGKGSVIFSWMESETNIQKFSMVYGYDLANLVYGIDNIPGSPSGPGIVRSMTISGLQPGRNVWDVVTAWQNGCPQNSLPLDPLVLAY